jgi:hypothetical protein
MPCGKSAPATEYSRLSTADGAGSVGIPTQATLTFGFRRHRRRPDRSGRIEGLLSVLLHDGQQEIDSLLVIFDEDVHGLPVPGAHFRGPGRRPHVNYDVWSADPQRLYKLR